MITNRPGILVHPKFWANERFKRYAYQKVAATSAAAALTVFGATKPSTDFEDTIPGDLAGRVVKVHFATAGTPNIVSGDDNAFLTPNVSAFQTLADQTAAGSGYFAWEAEANYLGDIQAATTHRYALDLWEANQALCKSNIDWTAGTLGIVRARQPSVKIGLEFGAPAVTAVSLAAVQGSLAADYAALTAYEQTRLAGLVDYVIIIGYLNSGTSLADWRAYVDFYVAKAQALYPGKPIHLLLNHVYDALSGYVGDANFDAMLDAAAEVGYAQLWGITGADANSAWNRVRVRLSLPTV